MVKTRTVYYRVFACTRLFERPLSVYLRVPLLEFLSLQNLRHVSKSGSNHF